MVEGMQISYSLGECMMYGIGGMAEYIPRPDNPFNFPVKWMLTYLSMSFITMYFQYNDIHGFGKYILLKGEKRKLWWYSKCVWNSFSIAACFVIIWFVNLMFAIICNLHINFNLTQESAIFLKVYDHVNDNIENMFLPIIILPVIVTVAINLLQMFLTLFLKPNFSFLVVATLYLVSSYKMSPIFLGNYLMPIRTKSFLENGLDCRWGIIISIIIIFFTVLVGGRVINRYDILKEAE